MVSQYRVLAGLSSCLLRALSYVFFRWIPGHPFPPLIYALAATYYASILFDRKWVNKKPAKAESETSKNRRENHGAQDTNAYVKLARNAAFGLPSPGCAVWNAVIIAINGLLVLGTLDVVYRGPILHPAHDLALARVGHVSPTTAKVLIREPDASKLPIHLSYHEVLLDPGLADPWKPGGSIFELSDTTDCTEALQISDLQPSTKYEYKLTSNHNGTFTTAPPLGARGNKLTFLTTSCIKPNFPYNPLSHSLRIPGLHHLSSLLSAFSTMPSFMLFLGDFIYIDVPHRHGSLPSTYRSEYRRVYASPSYPPISHSLPWLHVIDDHEIANDWDKGLSPPYLAAIDPWMHYHHSVNPPPVRKNSTYYRFRHGPATFFMLDTRRYRSRSGTSTADDPTKTMLGQEQLADVLAWLRKREPDGVKFKVLVSSIPFTRNWRINAMDTWGGYLFERKTLLEAMWNVNAYEAEGRNGVRVIVLSGDRHEFAATRFPPPDADGEGVGHRDVFEFSTSPLSMFYLPVRTYWEDISGGGQEWADWGRDMMVKYIPDGNSKVAAIEMEDIEETGQGICRFRLYVDGNERWTYEVKTG